MLRARFFSSCRSLRLKDYMSSTVGGEAIVRKPSLLLNDGLVTHMEKSRIDVDLALRQWRDYCEAMRVHGWKIIEAPPAPLHPDGVFIEDVVIVCKHLAIITRPGSESRRLEMKVMPTFFATKFSKTHEIKLIRHPGTLDGGDILKVMRDNVIYVGLGGRTNKEGIEQFENFVRPLGVKVVAVPISKVLHLKSAVTALPDGTIIGYEPCLDESAMPAFQSYKKTEFLAMPEEAGSHVVILGQNKLLMSKNAPKSAEIIKSRGYSPILVDISEFEKLEGCVTCLSVRIRV